MILLFSIFIFLIFILVLVRRDGVIYDEFDEYEEVTTTKTTTVQEYDDEDDFKVIGKIKRNPEGKQYFVIDPVDAEKIWVNKSDDLYRDASGDVWKMYD